MGGGSSLLIKQVTFFSPFYIKILKPAAINYNFLVEISLFVTTITYFFSLSRIVDFIVAVFYYNCRSYLI